MNHLCKVIMLSCALLMAFPKQSIAQNSEERFQDIFITAGYATAFGAALGAAALGLQNNPEENLNYIAVGASLGFIGGSIMGAYMVFSPVMADLGSPDSQSLLTNNMKPNTLYIKPHFSGKKSQMTALEGAMTIATF